VIAVKHFYLCFCYLLDRHGTVVDLVTCQQLLLNGVSVMMLLAVLLSLCVLCSGYRFHLFTVFRALEVLFIKLKVKLKTDF